MITELKPRPRWFRVLDALSQLFNVLIFNGEPNHSISGDAWYFRRTRLQMFIDFLFRPIEENHCEKSHYADVLRGKKLADEYYATQK